MSPRDAATIVLVRRASAGLEILFVRRHKASGFMGGAVVFPGGKVDDKDRDATVRPKDFRAGRMRATPGRTLSADEEAAFFVAACRETLEETGVSIAPEQLVYWAHWITPSLEQRRFDTRFFVGELTGAQTAAPDQREVTESMWMSAREALAAHATGQIFLPPPTQRTLEELAPYSSIEQIRAAAVTRYIAPILPKLTAIEGQLAILLPWDPLYATSEGEGLTWDGPVPEASSRIFIRVPGGAP